MLITICSSIDFSPKIIEVKRDLEQLNHKVNIPYFTQQMIDGSVSYEDYMKAKVKNGGDIDLRKEVKLDLIKRYWDFIKNSDGILVLNLKKKSIENYIGGSTLMEVGFAYGFGKKIYLYNQIPERSEGMHYIDEIMDMKPIVIHGDLSRIN